MFNECLEIRWKTAHFCILNSSFNNDFVWEVISSTVFHHQIEHLEVRQKYSAARNIFNSLLGGSSGGETLGLILDILEKSESHNLRGGGGGIKSQGWEGGKELE